MVDEKDWPEECKRWISTSNIQHRGTVISYIIKPTSLKALLTTHLGAYHLIMMSSLRPQLLITAYDMYCVEIINGNLQLKMIS